MRSVIIIAKTSKANSTCIYIKTKSNVLKKLDVDVDVDVDVEDLRAQANASMPASYIAN